MLERTRVVYTMSRVSFLFLCWQADTKTRVQVNIHMYR